MSSCTVQAIRFWDRFNWPHERLDQIYTKSTEGGLSRASNVAPSG